MADTIRRRIISNRVTMLTNLSAIVGCDYNLPFDPPARTSLPWAWLYDLDETYEPTNSGQYFNTLSLGLKVAFTYTEGNFGNTSNDLLRDVWAGFMADITCGGLAYASEPVWSGFFDAPGVTYCGELRMRVDISYMVSATDLTSQG